MREDIKQKYIAFSYTSLAMYIYRI